MNHTAGEAEFTPTHTVSMQRHATVHRPLEKLRVT